MVSSVQCWHDWSHELLVQRLRSLGIAPSRVIPLEEYLAACAAAGLTADSGFHELIERVASEMPPFAGELRTLRSQLLKTPS